MTPREILDVNTALKEITGTLFPFQTAREIANLQRQMKEELDTVAQMEVALMEKYGATFAPGDKTRLNFSSAESAEAWAEEYEAMMSENVDIDITPVDISSVASQLRISPSAVNALDGLIIFDGEDNGG